MTEKELEEYKSDFAMFIEAGFVAVKQLDEMSARRIFEAARLLNPESTAPDIGFGYIALNCLFVTKAAAIFEQVVEKEPDNHLAQMFLGISWLLSKTKHFEGEVLIKETLEIASDETIVNLGKIALDWSEKDLKRLAAPFFEEQKKKQEAQKKRKKKADEPKK